MRRERTLQLIGVLLCGALLWPPVTGFAEEPPGLLHPGPPDAEEDRSEESQEGGEDGESSWPEPPPDESASEPVEPNAPSEQNEQDPQGEQTPPEDDGVAGHAGQEEPDSTPEPREALLLSESEAVVFTFAELRELVEADNGVTSFYLGADIEFLSGGALIHENKQHVVFDGSNPIDGPDIMYTVTDVNSSNFGDAVRMTLSTEAGRSITVRNMRIEGRNYYSPFCVEGGTLYCELSFQNVSYRGPQFSYNRRGLVHIEDCDVTIEYRGASEAQELAEATTVRFAGHTRVDHTGSNTRVIFFETADGAILLEEDALVEIEMGKRDMSLVLGHTCTLELGRNATLLYRSPGKFTESPITSLVVGEGALLDARITGNPPDVVSIVTGDILVREGGCLRMQGEARNADRTLLRLTGNLHVEPGGSVQLVAEQGYQYLMRVLGGGRLHFEDPKSVLFYNPANPPFMFYDAPGGFSVEAQQVNYWSAPRDFDGAPGGLDDPPQSGWRRADGGLFTLSASVSTGDNPAYTAIESNYAQGDAPGYGPDAENFSLRGARMLAFGRIGLELDPLYETSSALTGETDHALAVVRASAAAWEEEYRMDAQADEGGGFELELLDALPAGTEVLVSANRHGLTAEAAATVLPSSVHLSVPDTLRFGSLPLRGVPALAAREEALQIAVTDTRGPGSRWRVTVRLEQPFTPQNASLPALRDALVFLDDDSPPQILYEDRHVVVAEHETGAENETVRLEWEPDRGILLRIPAGEGLVGQDYTAVIHWSLVDAP